MYSEYKNVVLSQENHLSAAKDLFLFNYSLPLTTT